MRQLAVLAALLLAACGDPKGADGYVFGEAEFERNQIAVTIVQHDSRASFESAAKARGIADLSALAAFAAYPPDEPRCVIHIERLSSRYEPEWLGHEMAHCIHGRWHP